MTYVSPYGKPEGMADRLREHVRRLGTDKSLPWVGLGLCDDLMKAAEMIDGKPGKLPLPEARAEVFASLANRNGPPGQSAPRLAEAEGARQNATDGAAEELEDWEKPFAAKPVATEYDL